MSTSSNIDGRRKADWSGLIYSSRIVVLLCISFFMISLSLCLSVVLVYVFVFKLTAIMLSC